MSGYKSAKKLMQEAEPYIYDSSKCAFMTGLNTVDRITGGFDKGELICIAGSPSMGKTGLMLKIIDNACIKGNKNCLYFTMGESGYLFLKRLISIASGDESITWSKAERDRKILAQTINRTKEAGLYINDDAYSISEIERICKKAASKCHFDMIVVDYLQLIRGEKNRSYPDKSDVVNRLKRLARKMKCPVIVLSRFTGKEQHREDHRPRLSDLDKNTGLVCYADKVLLLYRDGYYNVDSAMKNEMDIAIAKNTAGGGIGIVTV